MPACSLVVLAAGFAVTRKSCLAASPRFLWNGNVSIQAFVNIMFSENDCQSIIAINMLEPPADVPTAYLETFPIGRAEYSTLVFLKSIRSAAWARRLARAASGLPEWTGPVKNIFATVAFSPVASRRNPQSPPLPQRIVAKFGHSSASTSVDMHFQPVL
jgi:hypothetical protein